MLQVRPDAGDPGEIAGGVRPAGQLRVYLGAAAGAGKTIAMLDEGLRRREQGADVVIAFTEDHGRPAARARAAGLEAVTRQVIAYRGARFEEMDTGGVLRRRPRVALVDELAHTNVPGSGGNAKRWQDVLALLDAGIDVVTTVNIQHLDSTADAAEQITRVRVGERVPDWVVRGAARIEFVDSPPEELRDRMRRGEIYSPAQAGQALDNFFRAGNLAALRELAMRFVAGESVAAVPMPRDRPAGPVPGETAERMVAGVAALPGAEAMIRQAARMAARIEAVLDVVHVCDQEAGRPGRDDGLARLRQVVSARRSPRSRHRRPLWPTPGSTSAPRRRAGSPGSSTSRLTGWPISSRTCST